MAVVFPVPGMYDDRDVVVQAPQDVLARSPGPGTRLPCGFIAQSGGETRFII
jgi:hypothetical protein